LKLDYDVVEYLKKMKANITVFELCKIKQMREQLREALQDIQGPQNVVVGNSKATPKWKSTKSTKTIKALSVANTYSVESKEKTIMEEKKPNCRADGDLIGRRS
jgi:fumarylacetoacetate (FAA) hydrolase family protein